MTPCRICHACTRILCARRGTPSLLRCIDPSTPRGHAHHLAAAHVAVRSRTPRRPSGDCRREYRGPRRGLLTVWSRDDGRTNQQVRSVPRLLHLPGMQEQTRPAEAADVAQFGVLKTTLTSLSSNRGRLATGGH